MTAVMIAEIDEIGSSSDNKKEYYYKLKWWQYKVITAVVATGINNKKRNAISAGSISSSNSNISNYSKGRRCRI